MMVRSKRVLAWIMSSVLMMTMVITSFAADEPSTVPRVLVETSFETDLGGFVGRGDSTLERITDVKYEGEYAVLVSNRNENWHGASLPLTGIVQPGNTYEFVGYMAAKADVDNNYIMSGEYNAGISTGNQWPWLSNRLLTVEDGFVEFRAVLTMPEDMTNFNLNFEHQNANIEFYLDSVRVTLLEEADESDLPLNVRRAPITLEATPLHKIWADHFTMGNIYTPGFRTDIRGEVLAHHFNVITAENIMKPDHLQNVQGVFTFNAANDMMNFAKDTNQEVIGHTLIWHSQSFPWFEALEPTRDEAIEIMRDHIETVMGHFNDTYPGVITGWDVLNEAIQPRQGLDPEDWRLHLRDTKWLRAIGEDYIAIAFNIAHEMDPDAILYYNDYNDNDYFKATIIKAMVQELRDAGVPIHRIGMQGHYNLQTPLNSIRTSIERFSEITGHEDLPPIGISLTEIDVTVPGFEDAARLPEEVEIRQAQFYAQLMQILRDHSDVIHRVTFWGMSDRESWRADRHPNLLDPQYGPKHVFHAIADPDAFLIAYPLPETPDAQTALASKGQPVVGDFNLEAYQDSEVIPVANQMTAHNGATAVARVVWHEDAIYILANVTDHTPNVAASEAHEQDSLEVFISNTDSRISNYMPGDYQLRFNRAGIHSYGSTGTIEGMTFEVQDSSNGYQVEVRIPLEGEVYAGRRLGFDLQVNDAWTVGETSGRQAFSKWNDHTDNGWQSTEFWGWLVLDGDSAPALPVVLVDTSFETDLDGFNSRGSATLTRTDEVSHEGDYSVLVSDRAQNWHGASLPLTGIVQPGNTYEFVGYMAAKADVDNNYVMSGEYNEGISTGNQWPWLSNRTLTVEDGFVEFKTELTMPEDMTSFNLNFEHQDVNVEFYLDSVKVTLIAVADVTPGDPSDDPSVDPPAVLVYSMADDAALQGLEIGATGTAGDFDDVSEAMLVSGSPVVTVVAHPEEAGQISIELSNRSENWHALDFMFPAIGVERGGSYRFVANGRMAVGAGTGNRTIQWNQTDSPWNLIGSTTSVAPSATEWTIDVTLSRLQINTLISSGQRGLRIQTGNAATVTITIDDVFVYQIGDLDTEGLPSTPKWNFDEPRLAELFEPYFGLGNIYSTETLMNSNQTSEAFLHHFNVITAENGHKPSSIAGPENSYTVPTPEQFNFTDADRIVNFAIKNDIQLVGHALVWHSQSPNWLFRSAANTPLTRAEAKDRMEYYIKTVSEHFEAQGTLGAFYGWDVVNEAIASGGGTWLDQPGSWRTQMRTASPWYQAFNNGLDTEAGEDPSDYIFYAFYYARKYFPTSILYYNDYNDEIPAKRDAIAQMVEEINAIWEAHDEYDGRLLIESIGMQSHYHIEGWTTSVDNVRDALDRYIETGARVSVTELDITYGGHGSDAYTALSPEQLAIQAERYAQIFELYLERADKLSRVSIWGMADNSSWRSSGFPLLFDGSLSAKPAFDAIVDLVEGWATPEVAAPIIQTTALESLESGERIFTMLDVERGSNAPVWFNIIDGALPEGVTLHSRTGVLEGKPAEDGQYTFTVAAKNYGGETTQILTLKVGEVVTPPITPPVTRTPSVRPTTPPTIIIETPDIPQAGPDDREPQIIVTIQEGNEVTVDLEKLEAVMETLSDQVPLVLNVELEDSRITLDQALVAGLKDKAAGLEIQADGFSYHIPADVLEAIGEMDELVIRVSKPSDEEMELMQAAAETMGVDLVIEPVGVTMEVVKDVVITQYNAFDSFVTIMFALPDGVDPEDVTTGIALNPDGTFRSVPTRVVLVDDQYYAVVSSLSNSIYAVVYNSVRVASVQGRWSEAMVNNMASRMVIPNVDAFNPTADLTRTDFAVYLVRALGLEGQKPSAVLTDVTEDTTVNRAIATLVEKGIIMGYPDGTFKGDRFISREEMAVMIARTRIFLVLETIVNDVNDFEDLDTISTWANEMIDIVALGVYNGYGDGTLRPKQNITHEESLQVIYNALYLAELID
ncbi:UNVERIFIED_CONTAM: GH35 family endo-1,4-beta-xylanase [Acetivibrio alkalicellulosi]